MAKINKYLGFVLVGAATAAAAGAIAASVLKRKQKPDPVDYDEFFDDDFHDDFKVCESCKEEKETTEDFVSWEDSERDTIFVEPEEISDEEEIWEVISEENENLQENTPEEDEDFQEVISDDEETPETISDEDIPEEKEEN